MNLRISEGYDYKIVDLLKSSFHDFYEQQGSFYSFDFPLTIEWGEIANLQKYAHKPLRYVLFNEEKPIGLFQGIFKKKSLFSTLEAGSESGNGIIVHPAYKAKTLEFFVSEVLKKNSFSSVSIFSLKYIRIPEFLTKNSYTIHINLAKPIEDIIFNMTRQCRRAIYKAKKNKVQVEISDEDNKLEEAYGIISQLAETRNISIPQFKWINALHKKFKKCGNSVSAIARHDGEPISASYLLGYDGKLNWFLSGSKPKGYKLQAGSLIQMETIKWAKSHNYRIYDMGGTDPYDSHYTSIHHFKSGFGGILIKNYVVYYKIFYMPIFMKVKTLSEPFISSLS